MIPQYNVIISLHQDNVTSASYSKLPPALCDKTPIEQCTIH